MEFIYSYLLKWNELWSLDQGSTVQPNDRRLAYANPAAGVKSIKVSTQNKCNYKIDLTIKPKPNN